MPPFSTVGAAQYHEAKFQSQMSVKTRKLRVHSVVDICTGRVSPAGSLLRQMTEQQKHELRKLQLGKDKILNYSCPVCDQRVYLSGSGTADSKVYHFKHFANLGDCPIKDGENLSREKLMQLMYNGAKESNQHKKLKSWLGNFLKLLESKGDFESSKIEKRITSLRDRMLWRQPDVSCTYKGKRLVFELQLNPTFVEVISGREQFYHDEKTFICWLFDDFDPCNTDLSERDIFWLNKSNAFVLSDETMRLSEQNQDLYIECYYVKPVMEDGRIKNEWVRRILPFSDLSLSEGYYKPFYFDSDAARVELQKSVLVPEFISYILGTGRKELGYHERNAMDAKFIQKFGDLCPKFPMPQDFSKGFINIVDAINFLKHGVTGDMFNAYDNIKQYTNQIIQNYSEFGYLFINSVAKLRPDFKRDELSDKLRLKVMDFWNGHKLAIKEGRNDGQDRSYNSIIGIIYPELSEYLTPPTAISEKNDTSGM